MNCPECDSTNYIKYVDLTVVCPANTENLSELAIEVNKEIKVVGIDWLNERYFCPDCFDNSLIVKSEKESA